MKSLFGNGTVPSPDWRPEPNSRGTYGILASCLVTLVLCVWTAVHINIHPGGTQKQTQHKVLWLIFGVIAPEFIVFTAYIQRYMAKKIDKVVNVRSVRPDPSNRWKRLRNRFHSRGEDDESTHEFNMTSSSNRASLSHWSPVHSFYVMMGGFVIEDDDSAQSIFPLGYTRLTLSVSGVIWFLKNRPSEIPIITKAEIEDKSKGDGLTKTLVCIQATWFCIHCFIRFGAHLSISLLELNTLGHTICALVTYLMWWNKPLDVRVATTISIRSRDMREIVALMCVQSSLVEPSAGRNPSNDGKIAEYPGILQLDNEETFAVVNYPNRPVPDDKMIFHLRDRITGTSQEYRRWHYASEAIRKYRMASIDARGARTLDKGASNALRERSGNFPSFLESDQRWIVIYGLTLAGILYGGLHALGWNAPFPTALQRILWRVSSVSLMVSTPVGTLVMFYWAKGGQSHWILGWISFFILILYIFARVYLVVECFITLPYLPDSAFQVPVWSQYFLHFG